MNSQLNSQYEYGQASVIVLIRRLKKIRLDFFISIFGCSQLEFKGFVYYISKEFSALFSYIH